MTDEVRLVSRYMRPAKAILNINHTFKDAVKMMIDTKTNGLVIVDDNNAVVGILSSWDLIEYLVPDYLEADKHLAAFEAQEVFADRITQLANDSITKFMSSDVQTVRPDSTLIEAAALLSEFKIRQLPVVDEENHLVGYLNRTDIKLIIGEVLGL